LNNFMMLKIRESANGCLELKNLME